MQSGVWGRHPSLGRAEVHAAARPVADAAHLDVDDVLDALARVAGPQDAARATIDPERAAEAAGRAGAELVELARAGARLAFATATPASLLPLHTMLAATSRAAGARFGEARETAPYASGRRLWWHDAVAVVTDGHSLLEEHRAAAGDEWLLAVGQPALVVADGVFAAQAIAAGVPTIAFADLDEPGPALAARAGRPVLVVPLARHRPSSAYEALGGMLAAPFGPVPVTHDGDVVRHGPHLSTETPFPYAAPPSGGEG